MIFRPDLCQAILEGRKTQTRRLMRDGQKVFGHFRHNRGVEENGRVKWWEGRSYAIQPGRGKKAVGRILLRAIWYERLQTITPLGILAEGIDNGKTYFGDKPGDFTVKSPTQLRDEFATLWDSIHTKKGSRWEDNPYVWVLEFEKVT